METFHWVNVQLAYISTFSVEKLSKIHLLNFLITILLTLKCSEHNFDEFSDQIGVLNDPNVFSLTINFFDLYCRVSLERLRLCYVYAMKIVVFV